MTTEDATTHKTNTPHTPREVRALIAAGLTLVAAGCLPAPSGGYAFYALLPYAASVVLVGLAGMVPLGLDLRRHEAQRPSFERRVSLRARMLAAALAGGLATIGELVQLLLMGMSGTGSTPDMLACVLFALLCAGACACLIWAWKSGRS